MELFALKRSGAHRRSKKTNGAAPFSATSKTGDIHIRVFYSLLFLSVLETLVWSFCLFGAASDLAAASAAQAYYERETVNLGSTTGVPPQAFGFRSIILAQRLFALTLKDEERNRYRLEEANKATKVVERTKSQQPSSRGANLYSYHAFQVTCISDNDTNEPAEAATVIVV